MVAAAWSGLGGSGLGGGCADRAGCNTNSPSPPSSRSVTVGACLLMLLIHDVAATCADLDAGRLVCPDPTCRGQLGSWGRARPRWLRLDGGRSEAHTPRRVRCRECSVTHVLVWTRSYPRRPDTVETVAAALLAAAGGAGYRRIAEQIDRPATTVRGWLRRARVNCDAVRCDATVATYQLDVMADRLDPTGSTLGDMLDAVGRATSAWIRRFGPTTAPWPLAVAITGAAILAPVPTARWHGVR